MKAWLQLNSASNSITEYFPPEYWNKFGIISLVKQDSLLFCSSWVHACILPRNRIEFWQINFTSHSHYSCSLTKTNSDTIREEMSLSYLHHLIFSMIVPIFFPELFPLCRKRLKKFHCGFQCMCLHWGMGICIWILWLISDDWQSPLYCHAFRWFCGKKFKHFQFVFAPKTCFFAIREEWQNVAQGRSRKTKNVIPVSCFLLKRTNSRRVNSMSRG